MKYTQHWLGQRLYGFISWNNWQLTKCFCWTQGVTEVLCEACDQLGWKSPTKIQIEAIPVALQGEWSICKLCQKSIQYSNGRILHVLEIVLLHPTVNTLLHNWKQMHMQIMHNLNSWLIANCVKLHFFEILLPYIVPTHTLINVYLFFLHLQGRMLLDWRRLVQERPVPLLCQSYSLCSPHPRGFTPSYSLLPGSWPFRSLSSLRPLALALVLNVVCGLIFSFARNWLFWVCVLMHISSSHIISSL